MKTPPFFSARGYGENVLRCKERDPRVYGARNAFQLAVKSAGCLKREAADGEFQEAIYSS